MFAYTAKYSIEEYDMITFLFTTSSTEIALLVGESEEEEVHLVQLAQPLHRDRFELLEELINNKPGGNEWK